jgi:hypothetical protein
MLKTTNRNLAIELHDRLAARNRRLLLLENITDQSGERLAGIRVLNLARLMAQGSAFALAEEFYYAGPQWQVPAGFRR